MSDLCQTCGIRLTEGLCQCPEVLLAEIDRMRTKGRVIACVYCGDVVFAYRGPAPDRATHESALAVSVAHDARCPRNQLVQQARSLRAKLMRERANAHERCAYLAGLGSILAGFTESRCQSLHARARRLRAKAEVVERGGA